MYLVILFLSEPEIEPGAGASHVTRMEKAEVGLAVRLAGAWGTSTSCCVVTVITCNDDGDNKTKYFCSIEFVLERSEA